MDFPLSEQKARDVMKKRGYNEVSVNMSGDVVTTINFVKHFGGIILHASAHLKNKSVSLYFVDLKYLCELSAKNFAFDHKDFEKYEQIITMYAAKCMDIDVFQILDDLKGTITSIDEPPTPTVDEPKKDIKERKRNFWDVIAQYGKEKGYSKEMCLAFYNYWTEMNENGKKLRFEIEKTRSGVFDIKGRLRTWKSNEVKFNSRFKDRDDKRAEKQDKETKATKTINKNELF